MRKGTLGRVYPTKTQSISPCVRVVRSDSPLSVWKTKKMLSSWLSKLRPVKLLIRLRETSGWSESSFLAHISEVRFLTLRPIKIFFITLHLTRPIHVLKFTLNLCYVLHLLLDIRMPPFPIIIKALMALVGRLSLSVGWENDPQRGLKTVALNSWLPVF